MKAPLFITALLAAAGCATALPEAPSLEAALPVAKEQGRTILLDFTGKEWCPPCMYLKSKIFENPEFDRLTGDKYLLVEVVFPRLPEAKAAMGEAKMAENEALLASYNITTGFPTVVLHDEAGKPFAIITSPRKTVEEYAAELDKAQQLRTARDAAFAKAATLQGLERAKALAEGLNAIPEPCRYKYPELVTELNSLDPQNTLGYAKFLVARAETDKQMAALDALLQSFAGHFKPEEIAANQAKIRSFLEDKDLYPEVRQAALAALGDSYAFLRDYESILTMVDLYRQAAEAAPDTKRADKLRRNLKYYDETLLPMLKEQQEKKD